ncbi:MAG: hypothetical protein KKD00_05120 [Gammaproteobacteria bacterium]|nr:hypothetical protein [Gammaproteobacteria bacterium]
MLYKKLILAFILLFNHSLMFGVTEAAHIPDEEHPRGYAYHAGVDQHEHDIDVLHVLDHALQHISAQVNASDDAANHAGHDHHHKHGTHIHLNCELPYSLHFDFQLSGSQVPCAHLITHQSQLYSPPVPPPNH